MVSLALQADIMVEYHPLLLAVYMTAFDYTEYPRNPLNPIHPHFLCISKHWTYKVTDGPEENNTRACKAFDIEMPDGEIKRFKSKQSFGRNLGFKHGSSVYHPFRNMDCNGYFKAKGVRYRYIDIDQDTD